MLRNPGCLSRKRSGDMDGVTVGDSYSETVTVAPEHTAAAYGNAGVNVVATPTLIGFLEMAGVRYLENHIGADESSVGIAVNVEHLAAAPVGAEVAACITVSGLERNRVSFDVEASWGGTVLMRGSHLRVVVNREAFLEGLPSLK